MYSEYGPIERQPPVLQTRRFGDVCGGGLGCSAKTEWIWPLFLPCSSQRSVCREGCILSLYYFVVPLEKPEKNPSSRKASGEGRERLQEREIGSLIFLYLLADR